MSAHYHPLLPNRMPGSRLSDLTVKDFDGYEFFTTKGPKHGIPDTLSAGKEEEVP